VNILNNAAKYSDPEGKILLSVTKDANEAVISIRDEGIGISEDMLSRVFDMFGQIETPERQVRGGLGIGLSVVKKLVEMHGGMVIAMSEGRGKGSEFVVRLPLADPPANLQTAPATTRSGNLVAVDPSQIRRILVVDDNVDAAESLEALLRLYGHDVRTAFDGKSGLKIAEEFQPDLCLLDIGLPGMNGFELASRLRPLRPETLLISISGWGQDEDKRRSRDAGFNYHFTKPVDIQTIIDLIH
jgi:CheY-like chemotaxis protein